MAKFRLARTYRFPWPVEIKTPNPDKPGEFLTSTFKVEYEALPHSQMKEIEDEIAKRKMDVIQNEIAFLKSVIRGWKEVEDEDGNELPFNDENLSAVLEHSFVRGAMHRAFFAALNGRAAELGN